MSTQTRERPQAQQRRSPSASARGTPPAADARADFEDFVRRHEGNLTRICAWIESSGFLAYSHEFDEEDLQQEVLLRVWAAWGSFRPSQGGFMYLRRVALNTALNVSIAQDRSDRGLKRYHREGSQDPLVEQPDVLARLSVEQWVERLGPEVYDRARAFLEASVEGRGDRALAEEGLSRNAQRSRRIRARRALQGALEEMGVTREQLESTLE